MQLNPQLVFVDADNPPRWVLYALAVLNRAVAFGAVQQIQAWVDWAGGANFGYIAPQGPLASGAVVIQDGQKGIINLGGTRNVPQLAGQIIASTIIRDPVGEGGTGAFWGEYADRISPFLDAAIGGLPGNRPVLVFGHSLGAAVAQILACRYQFTGNRRVSSLVTTGQPRAGDASLQLNNPGSYTRIVNQGDPVTGVPPEGNTITAIGSTTSLGVNNYNYVHGGRMWQLTATTFGPGQDIGATNTLGTFLSATMQGSGFMDAVLQYHDIANYAERLYQLIEPISQRPGISALLDIVAELNAQAGNQQIAPPPQPMPPLPVPEVLVDPNVEIQPIPAHVPVADRNRPVQLIQLLIPRLNSPNANPILLQARFGMSALVKCTFFYAQRNQGWSETYYRSGSLADTIQKAYDLGSSLIKFRGTNTAITGFRLALVNVPTVYPRTRLAQLFPADPSWAAGTAVINGSKDSDAADTCMLMRCYDGTGAAAAKFIFWRGISDNFVTAGGVPIAGGMTAFGGDWVTLQTKLGADAWGWVGNTAVSTRQAITGLVQTASPSGYVAFTLAGNLFPVGIPLNQGITVPVRISQVITPGNINGSIPVVIAGNLSQCQSKKKIAILPWDGNSGVMTFNAKQFWQFKTYTAPGGLGNTGILLSRIGERKAGRPFGTPPGRSKNRVRA